MDPCAKQNYSYSYKDNNLCFETGSFGLKVSTSNLTEVSFGIFDDNNNDLSYLDALPKSAAGNIANRMDTQLVSEELVIEIISSEDDARFKSVETCHGGNGVGSTSTSTIDKLTYRVISAGETRLWESGMICQHYDFKQLKFQEGKKENNHNSNDGNGHADHGGFNNCEATLYILVWPDSITFTIELKFQDNKNELKIETKNIDLKPSEFKIRMKMQNWEICQTYNASETDTKTSLHCNVNNDNREEIYGNVNISCSVVKPRQDMQTGFSDHFNCYLLAKDGLIDRSFQGGYTDIRDYDLFHIQINNQTNSDKYIPILLFVQYLANATGLCPIICDMNFEPTGIYIQLSKNWHSMVRILVTLSKDLYVLYLERFFFHAMLIIFHFFVERK